MPIRGERALSAARAAVVSGYVGGLRALRRSRAGALLLARLERQAGSPAARYLRSLFAVHDLEAMAALDLPMLAFPAIRPIKRFLAAREGRARAFEYGPGASSFWLARRCAAVRFVEHDGEWWQRLHPLLAAWPNLQGRLVPPVPVAGAPRAGSGRAGWRGLDFTDYVAAIAEDGPFDLVLVDGRARAACLAAALAHLRPDGLIVLDDSGRRRYRPAIAASGLALSEHRGLAPSSPYPSRTALLARPSVLAGLYGAGG